MRPLEQLLHDYNMQHAIITYKRKFSWWQTEDIILMDAKLNYLQGPAHDAVTYSTDVWIDADKWLKECEQHYDMSKYEASFYSREQE